MKKYTLIWIAAFLMIPPSFAFAADKPTRFESSGEVVTVDPAYGRITIDHDSIKGFSASGQTEFFVENQELLKNISSQDLVDFTLHDERGDARIEKIVKTGVAVHEEEGLRVGEAVSDVLRATSETAKFVTSPLPPAQELTSATVGAVAEDTGEAVRGARGPKLKQNF